MLERDAAFEEPEHVRRGTLAVVGRVLLIGILTGLVLLFTLLIPLIRFPLKLLLVGSIFGAIILATMHDPMDLFRCLVIAGVSSAGLGGIAMFEGRGDTYVRIR